MSTSLTYVVQLALSGKIAWNLDFTHTTTMGAHCYVLGSWNETSILNPFWWAHTLKLAQYCFPITGHVLVTLAEV